jgi:four helix bundle protein
MAAALIQDTEVYKMAEKLSDLIWRAFDRWDYKAQHTIGLQVIRSADSIAANLAEGFGRFSPGDRKRYYHIARGSFEETKCWMRKAIRRGILSNEDRSQISEVIRSLGPGLNRFIKNQNITK